jgi:hypothetical protein
LKESPRVLHPFLLAPVSALYLFNRNYDQLVLEQMLLPLVFSVGLSVVVYVPLRLVLREPTRAGVVASLFLVLFFSRGYLASWLRSTLAEDDGLWWSRATGVASLALAAVVVWLVVRKRRPLPDFTRILNALGTILLSMQLVDLARLRLFEKPVVRPSPVEDVPLGEPEGSIPDIYHLVLDGYGRTDVFRELFGFDDEAFVSHLEEQGFYVARRARANYGQTLLSLGSTHNLDYFGPRLRDAERSSVDRRTVTWMLRNSRVLKLLRERGFRILAFRSGYMSTELRSADRVLGPTLVLDEFASMFVYTTAIPALSKRIGGSDLPFAVELRRNLVRYSLENVSSIVKGGPPTYVFLHVIAPHPPFLFDAEGNLPEGQNDVRMADADSIVKEGGLTRAEYQDLYREQAIWVASQVEKAVDEILSRDRPAAILIHGDHGPRSGTIFGDAEATDVWEAMSILNAFHWPSRNYEELHPELSPVNSYRVLFNAVFGAEYPLLEDRSFFSPWSRPFAFTDVTDRVVTRGR